MRPGRDEHGTRGRRAPAAAAILAIGLVLGIITAGSSPGTRLATDLVTPSVAPVADTPVLNVVSIGDSIPAGNNCAGCTPFIELFGQLLARDRASEVQVTNLGVGGATTADLLESLGAEGDDSAPVRDADVVTVTIGANDFASSLDGYPDGGYDENWPSTVDPDFDVLRSNLTTILQRLTELREGRPTTVLVTGYWNVFPDGDIARHEYGPGFEADSAALTRRVDDVIEEVATAHDAIYVDLLRAFKGSAETDDPTELLADDGDHPNQAGHQKISEALSAAMAPRSADR